MSIKSTQLMPNPSAFKQLSDLRQALQLHSGSHSDSKHGLQHVLLNLREKHAMSLLDMQRCLTDLIRNDDMLPVTSELRELAIDLITDVDMSVEIAIDTIKVLVSLLSSDTVTSYEVQRIVRMFASVCNCDDVEHSTQIARYRQCILYECDTVYDIACFMQEWLSNDEYRTAYQCVWLSVMRSCVYSLLVFLPRRKYIITETEWFDKYGEMILSTLCTCVCIKDRPILGDICDALAIIYVLNSRNNSVAAICAKQLQLLATSGQYFMVKKAAKQSVMSIVVEFYIRQCGCSELFPVEIVFQLMDYTGFMQR